MYIWIFLQAVYFCKKKKEEELACEWQKLKYPKAIYFKQIYSFFSLNKIATFPMEIKKKFQHPHGSFCVEFNFQGL